MVMLVLQGSSSRASFKTLDDIIGLVQKAYLPSWFATLQEGRTPDWHASISQDQFAQVTDAFVDAMQHFVEQTPWVGPETKGHDAFCVGLPFVQKICVDEKKRVLVAIIGDLHADVATTAAFFKRLQRDDYLLDDGTINPQLPNGLDEFRIVCLGDYLDRGSDSVGTMTLLLHVATKNPGQVILLRGNHDNAWLVDYRPTGGSAQELVQRFGKKGFSAVRKQLRRIKNFFPSALYLGQRVSGQPTRYMVFCHGIIDFGFNAQPLLESKQDQAFCRYEIDHKAALRRAFKKKPPVAFPKALQNLSRAVKQNIIPQLFHECDLVPDGMDGLDADFVGEHHGRLFMGKHAVQLTMQLQSTKTATVSGAGRGHQHDGGARAQPMSQAIFGVTCNPAKGTCMPRNPGHVGVSKIWGDDSSRKNAVWDGCVCTFAAAPDINLGHLLRQDLALSGIDGDFAAYGLFNLKDWTLQAWRISLDEIAQLTGMRIKKYANLVHKQRMPASVIANRHAD